MSISIDNQQSKRAGKNNEVSLCCFTFSVVVAEPEFAPAPSLAIKSLVNWISSCCFSQTTFMSFDPFWLWSHSTQIRLQNKVPHNSFQKQVLEKHVSVCWFKLPLIYIICIATFLLHNKRKKESLLSRTWVWYSER